MFSKVTNCCLLILLLLQITFGQCPTGPADYSLAQQPANCLGPCRLCEIDCLSIANGLFSYCPRRYHRYGCDSKFFCLSTSELKYNEKYVAVMYCMLENGCVLNSGINSFAALERTIDIQPLMRMSEYMMTSPETLNPRWLSFIAKRNAFATAEIYKVITEFPGTSDYEKMQRMTKIRPLFFSYLYQGSPGPLIRFKQALDISEIKNNYMQVIQYLNKWAYSVPWWLTQALNPVTTYSEAAPILDEAYTNSWVTKPFDQFLTIRVPEFVFYRFATQKLEEFTDQWATKLRTYKDCNMYGPNMYGYCSSFNFNLGCNLYVMKNYCQSMLDTLGIYQDIDDARIFIESIYYGRMQALGWNGVYSPARMAELKARELDSFNQVRQEGTIGRAILPELKGLYQPVTPVMRNY